MSRFDGIRKKMRRRRIEAILLAGYAFAVTCALIISLITRDSSPRQTIPVSYMGDDSYDFNTDVLTPAFNDSVKDNPFEAVYMQVNNVKLLSNNKVIVQKFELAQNEEKSVVMPVASKPQKQAADFAGLYQKERHVLIVEPGDTFIGILTKIGMDNKTAAEAYNVLKKVYDTRHLRAGQHIELTGTFDVQFRQLEMLDTLTIEPERGTKYILRVNEYDKFEAKVEQEKFEHDVRVVEGSVSGLPSASMIKAGVPNRLAMEVISRMSYLINFRTDVHKGDTFKVKYDVSKAADGSIVKSGQLLFASFTVGTRTFKIYRYNNEFYNEKGETKKTGLDIKPLAMRNARISSLYGYRRHPIYKTQKFHSGVDYAAPKGTAIYASGNGVVEIARYVNGYGNFVKIRHNSQYETGYGHMQRFASGIRPGVHVRKGQIIGYVGSTGRSTGPHLHFEIILKGQRINPLKAKVATGNDLGGRQLADFKNRTRQIDAMVEKIKKVEKPITPVEPKQETVAKPEKQLDENKQKIVDGIKEMAALEQKIIDEAALMQQGKDMPNLIGGRNSVLSRAVKAEMDRDGSDKAQNGGIRQAPAVRATSNIHSVSAAPVVEEKTASTANTEPTENTATETTEPTENTAAETEQTATVTTPAEDKVVAEEQTPAVDEYVSNYKGKIIYPPKVSSSTARQKYSPSAKNARKIKIPRRKPRYARR